MSPTAESNAETTATPTNGDEGVEPTKVEGRSTPTNGEGTLTSRTSRARRRAWSMNRDGEVVPLTNRERSLALIAGILFVVTFLTAIPAALLYDSILNDQSFILGEGAVTLVFVGATLELLLIVANIGTALALFPLLRRQSEALALGYVAARIVESTFIAVGILSLLAVVTMRQDAAGADPDSLVAIGQSLVAVHDWTFLLGPGFVVGIGNGMLLGYLMFRSGLVPRRMAMLGLVGGPLVCASGIAVMFGAIEPGSPGQAVATIPEIAWEASLGIYLVVKGRRSGARYTSSYTPAASSSPESALAAQTVFGRSVSIR